MFNSRAMVQDTYLPAADAALYTVAAGYRGIVKEIILCNTDVAARTVTICFMKGGGTLAKGTVLNAYSLAPNESKILSLSSVLNATDAIHGVASAANVVTILASGIEENV